MQHPAAQRRGELCQCFDLKPTINQALSKRDRGELIQVLSVRRHKRSGASQVGHNVSAKRRHQCRHHIRAHPRPRKRRINVVRVVPNAQTHCRTSRSAHSTRDSEQRPHKHNPIALLDGGHPCDPPRPSPTRQCQQHRLRLIILRMPQQNRAGRVPLSHLNQRPIPRIPSRRLRPPRRPDRNGYDLSRRQPHRLRPLHYLPRPQARPLLQPMVHRHDPNAPPRAWPHKRSRPRQRK